jgi:hypothetical protein
MEVVVLFTKEFEIWGFFEIQVSIFEPSRSRNHETNSFVSIQFPDLQFSSELKCLDIQLFLAYILWNLLEIIMYFSA